MPFFRKLFGRVRASTYYRKYIYTDPRFQLVAMSLRKGESIGAESHEVTQTFFILGGRAVVLVGEEVMISTKGDVIVVPAGTNHNVTGGSSGCKLLTVYAPMEHPIPTRDERFR